MISFACSVSIARSSCYPFWTVPGILSIAVSHSRRDIIIYIAISNVRFIERALDEAEVSVVSPSERAPLTVSMTPISELRAGVKCFDAHNFLQNAGYAIRLGVREARRRRWQRLNRQFFLPSLRQILFKRSICLRCGVFILRDVCSRLI
ncbi:hypothetical protein BECAL_01767 [Bellilinea caldifistulae]|nr:hypothetical protein BECAL_01767 [Bellilinea caldifistulae]